MCVFTVEVRHIYDRKVKHISDYNDDNHHHSRR